MKTKKDNTKQLKLFAPSPVGFVAAKDQQDLMTYPFFSLSKRKRFEPIHYDDGRIKVTVSGHQIHGIANIYDADILIYVASQIMEARNKGRETSPRIKMSQYDILEFLGKSTSGTEYRYLKESLERLQSTSISTTIRREGSPYKYRAMFSWIAEWKAIEKNGRPVAIEFELSRWLYDGIVEGKVLTLPRKYFRISSGLNRFLYRLCRKFAGNGDRELLMKLDNVKARSGTTRKPAAFRKQIQKVVDAQDIPDYWVFLIKRPKTEDWYFAAYSREYYKTKAEAYAAISFVALEKVVGKNNGGT